MAKMIEGGTLKGEELRFHGLTFHLRTLDGRAGMPPETLVLCKSVSLVRELDFFFRRASLNPQSVLELGFYGGSSLLFWANYFPAATIVGVDHGQVDEAFLNQIAGRPERNRISARVAIDQSDQNALRRIVDEDCGGVIDLVLDDCSHRYQPTKDSFEALFPRLRSGGWYVIEDWAWSENPRFLEFDQSFRGERPLLDFIDECVRQLATDRVDPRVISSIEFHKHFVAIQRGTSNSLRR